MRPMKTCPACGGEGTVTREGKKFFCPTCKGHGRVKEATEDTTELLDITDPKTMDTRLNNQ